ncbi:MAG TPA: pitrilysin family protein [Vicinamibacterales bacterium]|nr:pitrilysin family protein [Vicinamibacterales bacterium]
MKLLRLPLLVLALLVSVSPNRVWGQAGAPTLPAGVQRITSVEGITEYQLPNGLRTLLFPDQSKSTITVNITYLVGSKHENYGETGMAHLLEHMVFKGSTRHTNIPKELQDHGSRPNGTTSYERTNYFETFSATDANLEWALDLESDRMVNSFIAKKDLDSEMTVVRNEFEQGENSPLRVLYERVLSTAYLWHNYGKSTIGSRSDIENVPIDRLQAFYRGHYQPDNALLVVAGKIDETKTLGLIAKYFGPIPKPQRTLPTIYTAEPTQDGERTVTLQRVGDVQNIVVGYHVPAGSHPDYQALQMASQILTDNPSGRLYKALVETKKASQIAGQGLQLRDAGMIMVLAEVRKESSLDDARTTLLTTIDAVKTTPFTSEEVERVRNRLLTQIDLQLNNSEQMALSLSNWASMGDWRLFFLNRDRIKQTTLADVQRVATYYLKPANRTLGVFVPAAQPDRAEIPSAPDLVATFKDFKGSATVSAGEVFDSSPANIEGRLRRVTLPGGTKAMLLPKKTRGETVSAVLRLSFGDEKSLAGQSAVAQMTGQLLMRGTTKHTRQQIQDELDRLKARMFVGGGAGGATVTIETIAANLPAVLELATEVLREPSFPAAELETLRQQALAGIESQKSEPTSVTMQAFQSHLNPYPKGDVRHVSTFDEQLADMRAVTLDQVKQFHSGFYGASNAELAVVGDFDPEAILKAASALNGWKSPKAYAQIKNPYRRIDPVNQQFETPDKANAFFLAGMHINISDDNPDYPSLMFANYLLGQGINSRLFARIRGKEGLSYGISSSLGVTPGEDNATFITNAISAPENAAKVEASFRDEMTTLLKDGFSDAEIAAGKASWLQAQQLNRDQNGGLANLLVTRTHYGRTMAWDAELEKKVQSLTSQQITAALRKFFDVSTMTFMKGGDFKKAASR